LANWLKNLTDLGNFFHRKKDPSQMELLHTEGKYNLMGAAATEAMRGIDAESQASGDVDFVFQSTKDEWILGLFDPSYPQFCPLVLPLAPLFQATIFLTYCTEHQARTYKRMVDRAITRLKNECKRRQDFMLLESLRGYAYMRINDSVMGFKLDKLTTRKKILEMPTLEGERKK
jgi:hypothetical protein